MSQDHGDPYDNAVAGEGGDDGQSNDDAEFVRAAPSGLNQRECAAFRQGEVERINRVRARRGDPFTRPISVDDLDSGQEVRRPPVGMSRRDRRQWRMLEAARMHRVRAEGLRVEDAYGSYRGGFIASPPRRLDRRSRKAWLEIERSSSKAWWEQRRASTSDIEVRSVGALVLALVLGAGLVIWLVFGSHRQPAAASPSSTGATPAVAVATPMSTAGGETSARANAALTNGAAISDPRAGLTVGPAGEPGRVSGGLGGWSPTPASGVAPVAAQTSTSVVNPASVRLEPVPAGAPTVADTATPQATVTAWLARTCPSSWTEAYGANLQRGRALLTADGWSADDPAGDTASKAVWQHDVVADRQTRRCGDLTAMVSADTNVSLGAGFVFYTADRVVTSDRAGFTPVVEHVSGSRAVVRQSDGRWLVGPATAGG